MPFEQPLAKPEIETHSEKELGFVQMQKEEQEILEGVMTKLGRASRKMKTLMAGVILTGFLAGSAKEAKAFDWGRLGQAVAGTILKEGVEKIKQGIEERQEIERIKIELKLQIKEKETELQETKEKRGQEIADLLEKQVLEKREFELENPQATPQEKELFELKQKKEELELKRKWGNEISALELEIEALKSQLEEFEKESSDKKSPEEETEK